jgi:Ca2+/Na+ antiporter
MTSASINIVVITSILIAFVVVVVIMIRKSMNSTEELRRELEKGYSAPKEPKSAETESAPSTVRLVTVISLLSISVIAIIAVLDDWILAEFLFVVFIALVLPVVFLVFDDSTTRKQETERQRRIETNPPRVEVIDSLESYEAFLEREGLRGIGTIARANHVSKLTRDIYDHKRNVVVRTEFLDQNGIPPEVKKKVELLKSGIEYGVRYESNPTYSRTHRQFGWWAIALSALVGLISMLLNECT